mgnify:CR=1 FL=1
MSELSQHDQIVQAFNNYLTEASTFDEKGVKAAHTAFDLDADQIEAVVYGGSGR